MFLVLSKSYYCLVTEENALFPVILSTNIALNSIFRSYYFLLDLEYKRILNKQLSKNKYRAMKSNKIMCLG